LDFWSRLTHELLGRLKFAIPNLQIYYPKKANFEKLGLGIDNPCRVVFLSLQVNKCLERFNDQHFWNPGVKVPVIGTFTGTGTYTDTGIFTDFGILVVPVPTNGNFSFAGIWYRYYRSQSTGTGTGTGDTGSFWYWVPASNSHPWCNCSKCV
jgi:hypothetical protein